MRLPSNHPLPVLLATLLAGCHPPEALPGVDPDMARCVTSDTLAVAGVRLDIRTATLPPAWSAALEPFREATSALLAYNGKQFLVIARGHFSAPPPGGVLLAKEMALAGPAELVRAATLQRATGRTGAFALLEKAQPFAAMPVWFVVHGTAQLPLPGNLANLNQLLHMTEYTAVGLDLGPSMKLQALATCTSPGAAQHFEETIRAMLTLARAANRDPDLGVILRSAEVQRTGLIVQASMTGSRAGLDKLLR